MASSRFTRDSSISTSVSGRWLAPRRSSFPAFKARTQFSSVDLGSDSRIAASPTDRPPSVTSSTASRRSSFVNLLYGSYSILTLPFVIYHKLWRPFFSTYPIDLYFNVRYAARPFRPKGFHRKFLSKIPQ
jgi:hypothetical protein